MFEKSLSDGTVDIRFASVMFVGSKDSLSTSAKRVIFQDTISAPTTPSVLVDHDIYYQAQGDPMLKKTDDYDDVIIYSLCNEKIPEQQLSFPQLKKRLTLANPPPSKHNPEVHVLDQLQQSKSSTLLRHDHVYESMDDIDPQTRIGPIPSQTNFDSIQPQQSDEIKSISPQTKSISLHHDAESQTNIEPLLGESIPPHHDNDHAQALGDAADCSSLVKSMTNYKDNGHMVFYNVFDFGNNCHMNEFFKIFVRNISLCAFVTDPSNGFDSETFEKCSYFSSKGLVVELYSTEASDGGVTSAFFNHFNEYLIKNSHQPPSYIFPINPEDTNQRVNESILSHALATGDSQHFPFSWYMFGFRLRMFMVSQNRSTASVSKECMVIARELKMDRSTVEAALDHLMDKNIVLYFKDIMNDVVFLGVHIFSDIFSALNNSQKLAIINETDLINATTRYCNNDLSGSDFITLFTKLLIIAPYDSVGNYLIPCLLAPLDESKRMEFFSDSDLQPAYFKCPSSGNEFMSMLTVFLLTRPKQPWKILLNDLQKPKCLQNNCVQFSLRQTGYIVTIKFFNGHIEVYVKPHKSLNQISTVIFQGLELIKIILNSHHFFNFSISFKCICGKFDAMYNSDSKLLTCKENVLVATDQSTSAAMWTEKIQGKSKA